MIFAAIVTLAILISAMMMSMMGMPTPAWVRVAAVAKRRR
jgi:hypothetical protein